MTIHLKEIGNDNIDLDMHGIQVCLQFRKRPSGRNGTSHGLELFGGSGGDEIVKEAAMEENLMVQTGSKGRRWMSVHKGAGCICVFNRNMHGVEQKFKINEILLDEESWMSLRRRKNVFQARLNEFDFTSGRV